MQDTSGFRFSNLRLPGNGMYNVQQTKGRYTKFERSYGAPKMIAELRVRYSDGKSETIATDSQWQVAPGPIRFSSTYGGEDSCCCPVAAQILQAGAQDGPRRVSI